jgi:hypothetical protein
MTALYASAKKNGEAAVAAAVRERDMAAARANAAEQGVSILFCTFC